MPESQAEERIPVFKVDYGLLKLKLHIKGASTVYSTTTNNALQVMMIIYLELKWRNN